MSDIGDNWAFPGASKTPGMIGYGVDKGLKYPIYKAKDEHVAVYDLDSCMRGVWGTFERIVLYDTSHQQKATGGHQ